MNDVNASTLEQYANRATGHGNAKPLLRLRRNRNLAHACPTRKPTYLGYLRYPSADDRTSCTRREGQARMAVFGLPKEALRDRPPRVSPQFRQLMQYAG